MDTRAIAARIVARVLDEGKNLDNAFVEGIPASIDARDKAFIKELCYGVLRWYPRLEFFLKQLLIKSGKRLDTAVLALILCGQYQLEFLRTPAHAAISATVNAAVYLDKPWSKQLINAILRRYQRESVKLAQELSKSESAHYAHPQWLIDAIRHEWPDHWQAILNAGNQKPPMHLRVNLQKISRVDYLQHLTARKIEAVAVTNPVCAIKLPRPVDVTALPGFTQGLVSIQDIGAQQAAMLLDLRPAQRVLDACAAPGGKCAHILETRPDLALLTAVEREPARMERLRENCRRLGLNIDLRLGDARVPVPWWDGSPYDRILLDLPCSATGVIRRHPDIKLLRHAGDIDGYAEQQYHLLTAIWPLLRQQGRLLYVTCSILARENDQQIEKFLKDYPDARNLDMIQGWGVKTAYGVQTLPGIGDADGFYYAVLEKR